MAMPKKYLVLRKCYHNGRMFKKDRIVDEAELGPEIPRHFLPLDSRKNPEVAMYEARETLAKKQAQFGKKYNPNAPDKVQKEPEAQKEPAEKE